MNRLYENDPFSKGYSPESIVGTPARIAAHKRSSGDGPISLTAATFDQYVGSMKSEDADKLRELLRQDTNAPLHYWLDILRHHGFKIATK